MAEEESQDLAIVLFWDTLGLPMEVQYVNKEYWIIWHTPDPEGIRNRWTHPDRPRWRLKPND